MIPRLGDGNLKFKINQGINLRLENDSPSRGRKLRFNNILSDTILV